MPYSGSLILVSNTYETWTSLFTTFAILGVAVGAVVLGLMTFLILRYRDRGSAQEPDDAPVLGKLPPERGKPKTLLISVTLSAIVLMVLVFGTFGALDTILNPPKEGTLDVTVRAFQWGWTFKYPNGYEETGDLRVPAGRPVKLTVLSDDVFHTFGISDFRIKRDAIPGRVNMIWFEPTQPGEFIIQCFELCGIGHAFMTGKLKVMEPSAWQDWYAGLGRG